MTNAVFSARFQGGRLELGGRSLFGVSPRGGTSAWELQLPYSSLGDLQAVVVAATGAAVGSRTKGVGLEVRTTVGSSYPVAEIGLLDGTGSLLTVPAAYLSDLTLMLTALAAAWGTLGEDDLDSGDQSRAEPRGLSEETLAALRSEQSATIDDKVADGVAPKLDKTEAATTYAKSGVESTQRLMALLKSEARNAQLSFFGDSTGNETTEWIYKLVESLAVEWPRWTILYRLWNDTSGSYNTATTVQTGTGTRTLTVYNASVSGFQTLDWLGAKLEAALAPMYPDPELIVLSLGHNEGSAYVAPGWHGRYLTLTETLAAAKPGANMLCIAQNPATANTLQGERAEVYREIAAHRGFGFIDVHQAFLDTGNAPALTVDGIHPNTAGTDLWLGVVKKAFTFQPGIAPRSQSESMFLTPGDDLLLNGDFASYAGATPYYWSATNCTTAQDFVSFESDKGWSLKVTAAAVGGTLTQDINVRRVKGRWVTLKARLRIGSEQGAGVGRVGVLDSNGSVLTESFVAGRDGFKDVVLTKFVSANATYLRVSIYPAHTDGGGVVNVENITLSIGKYPHGRPVEHRRIPSPAGTTALRRSAAAAGAGYTYYDTTLLKLIYSDGTTWRDAMGTAV